jgi:hypothetical protein
MKTALHAGLITLIIIVALYILNCFIESNYSRGQYDIFILYYVIINSLILEKLLNKNKNN